MRSRCDTHRLAVFKQSWSTVGDSGTGATWNGTVMVLSEEVIEKSGDVIVQSKILQGESSSVGRGIMPRYGRDCAI